MKVRGRKKLAVNARGRKRAANPLRIDPTRTASLRKQFCAELRRRFARLRLAVTQMLVDEDALGLRADAQAGPARLAGNTFCATGAGGGVDPSCSPGGGGRSGLASRQDAYEARSTPGPNPALPNESRPPLDYEGRAGLKGYGGDSACYELNHALNKGEVLQGTAASLDSRLQAAFVKAQPFSQPVAVSRGMQLTGSQLATLTAKLQAAHENGTPVTFGSYLSTTTHETTEQGPWFGGNLAMEITAHYGLDTKPHSKAHDENELMLDRGSSFRVRGLEKTDYGWKVQMEQINHRAADKTPHGGASSYVASTNAAVPRPSRFVATTLDGIVFHAPLAANTRWRFATSPEKLQAFQTWLRSQVGATLTGTSEEELWSRYVEAGFRRGAGRAFDDATRSERALAAAGEKLDFYAGTRDQFLRGSFGRPVAVEKVKLLAARSFDELENVTADMGNRMSRVLADGLVTGASPLTMARTMAKEVDISRGRAEVIARSEIIRSHSEGQLEALEQLGVESVGVAVEWSTAGDDKTCPRCAALEGVVLKLDEAHGLLPLHPSCRCSFIPSGVGESDTAQKATKPEIDAALAEADVDDLEVDEDRPESILGNVHAPELAAFSRWVANTFCPTGEGGGVDPTCSPGGAGGGTPAASKGAGLRAEKTAAARDTAAKLVAKVNAIHGREVRTLTRPQTLDFADPHRQAVEHQVTALLGEHARDGDPVAAYTPETGQTWLHGPVGVRALVSPGEDDGAVVVGTADSHGRTATIRPGDPTDQREYQLRRALRLKMPPELKDRFGQGAVANTFCPTGVGGGVDPTCSPGGGSAGAGGQSADPWPSEDGAATANFDPDQPRDDDDTAAKAQAVAETAGAALDEESLQGLLDDLDREAP